jgi:hypothetical protein
MALAFLVVAFALLGARAAGFQMFAGWNCLMVIGPCSPQQVDWLRGGLGVGGGALVGVVFGLGLIWIIGRVHHHAH